MSADHVDYGAPNAATGRPAALKIDAHKGDAGRVLIIAGSREMPGAAILCVRGALRGGAGLVTLACLDRELMELAPVAVPEAILWDLSAEPDTTGSSGNREHTPETLFRDVQLGLEVRQTDVIVLGPGMGNTPRTANVLKAVLGKWHGPLVIDADGLNAIASAKEHGDQDLSLAIHKRGLEEQRDPTQGPMHASTTVLTPHPGEARRLVAGECGTTAAARLQTAASIATDLTAVVCLKGAGTVISDGTQAAVNPTGNPGMATAGSGDVLAGLTGAYLAQVTEQFTAFAAARAAVFVHGHAGDLAAAELGQRSLIASDLVDFIGRAEETAPWGS